MNNNLDHYITRNIKSLYKRKLLAPILYLLLLFVLWLYLPVDSILFPTIINDSDSLEKLHKDKDQYIQASLSNLKFTGYTKTSFGRTIGYYYYTMRGNTCTFVLLSPHTCEEGLPSIEEISVYARIEKSSASYKQLLSKIAEDLSWTDTGITKKVDSYYISEPGFRWFISAVVIIIFALTGLYSLLTIIFSIIYFLFPVLSPPCKVLSAFGRPAELLAQAEEELATLPQLATEDMFITEHFFIAIAKEGIFIIPIQEIIWIYKYSTLHKFFWYHFSISYTLHITANKHLYVQLPKNLKSDIDGIIDYLSEANHDILVGFNETNRLKIQEIQGKPFQLEKFVTLLKKRI